MVRDISRWSLASATFPLVLSGCGTLMNLRSVAADRDLPPSEVPRAAVYGGVQLDAAAGKRSFEAARERPGQALVGAYVWGVDLPASAVADTLTLPVTVPATIRRGINEYYFPDPTPAGDAPPPP